MPERDFSWPVYDIFTVGDGRQMFVGAVTDGQWKLLCGILGLGDYLTDPRLQSRMDLINARDWTIPVIAAALADRDFDELVAEFEDAGIPFSPIRRPAEMYDDPHVTRPGGLHVSSLPEGGSYRAPGLPVEVNGATPAPGDLGLPDIGADNAEVLASLDMTPEDIAAATGAGRQAAE